MALAARPVAASDVEPADNSDVLVVVPMYNEGRVIADVVADLRRSFPHVLCVDDGSDDDSAVNAERAGATVVRHPINLGQGAALQTAFEVASRSAAGYVVTFDADGQHRVSDAERLVTLARAAGTAVVLGSRFLGGDATSIPWLRRGVLRAAVVFTRLTTGLSLTDTHNGLRVLSREALDNISLTQSGMAHASELLSLVRRHRLSLAEAPVSIDYTEYSRRKGQSTLNAVNVIFELMAARAQGLS